MDTGIKVGDIMTRNFASISPDFSLIGAAKEMIKKRVGSLVVLKNKELKGILTERDIIWAMIKKKNLDNIKVEDVAKRKVYTIKPSADLYVALKRIKETGYRRLPVLVKDNVIGVLTLKDILRVEPSLFESAREIMQIKEEKEKMNRIHDIRQGKLIEGICEECGTTDILYNIKGKLICESCKGSL